MTCGTSPCPTVGASGLGSYRYWFAEETHAVDEMPSEEKPPYAVLSMATIAALPWNGLTVASLFSGCGGSSLGYKMAGYHVLWANEFIPAAQEVYRLNHPETLLDPRDIRQVQASEILAACGMEAGQLDLLDGSPPCASFSTAGNRAKDWGRVKAYSDTKQRTDDLFLEYVRLVKDLQPKVCVAENVSGLVKGVAKGYFKEILAALKACGYVVEARLLDAQWLGVPQMRQRIIFQGVRKDLGKKPAWPTPLPYRYSVKDALPWIVRQGDNAGFGGGGLRDSSSPSPTIGSNTQAGNGRFPPSLVEAEYANTVFLHDESGQWSQGDITAQPAPTVRAGRAGTLWVEEANGLNSDGLGEHRLLDVTQTPFPTVQAQRPVRVVGAAQPEHETDISRYAIGREGDRLSQGEQSSRYFQLVKPSLTAPCPTITCPPGSQFSPTAPLGSASVVHPTEKRKFTIAELKRICAFPDDFQLTGSYAQQWERLGRAVPPVMMAALATVIRDQVLRAP